MRAALLVLAVACSAPAKPAVTPAPESTVMPSSSPKPRKTRPLEWHSESSDTELSSTAAAEYCENLTGGWRLPNKLELKSLVAEPNAQGDVLRNDAPELPPDGFLWSGEDVSAARVGQRWLINLANGHIFNGHGRNAHAKCVRGDPLLPPQPDELPPGYSAFLGPANAKLTIIVAMQLDYWWFKVRPTLDQLMSAYPIRFELHIYVVTNRHHDSAHALCAAARSGRLVDFERRILAAGYDKSRDPAVLRGAALDSGIKPADFDRDVIACAHQVAQDGEAMVNRGATVTPTFFIGKREISGAQTYGAFEAVIKAELGLP